MPVLYAFWWRRFCGLSSAARRSELRERLRERWRMRLCCVLLVRGKLGEVRSGEGGEVRRAIRWQLSSRLCYDSCMVGTPHCGVAMDGWMGEYRRQSRWSLDTASQATRCVKHCQVKSSMQMRSRLRREPIKHECEAPRPREDFLLPITLSRSMADSPCRNIHEGSGGERSARESWCFIYFFFHFHRFFSQILTIHT